MKLKIGNIAPAFESIDENGKKIALSDFLGKKVILFFYPRDLTPTCTIESCNLRDNYKLLKEQGFEVIGVSADDTKKHQRFISKYKFPYHLVADINKLRKEVGWSPKFSLDVGLDKTIQWWKAIDLNDDNISINR